MNHLAKEKVRKKTSPVILFTSPFEKTRTQFKVDSVLSMQI